MSEPKFAILRVQKLKDLGSVMRSLKHSFREQNTPNANSNETHLNMHFGANSAKEAHNKFKGLLPEKRRKDAVLAIEYLITASPEVMKKKSKAEQDQYFIDSLKWLNERHGRQNIVYAGVHRDETTPHLYAYAVPLDKETGRLNAKKWLGGPKALNQMQTEFAEKVGKSHGLDRGIEGSKAKHQTLKKFYGKLEESANSKIQIPVDDLEPRVLSKSLLSKTIETKAQIVKRINDSLSEQFSEIAFKASISDSNKEKMETYRNALNKKENSIEGLTSRFKGLSTVEVQGVFAIAEKMRETKTQRIDQDRSNKPINQYDNHER